MAPAGSTVCFHESLLHASGQITSGKDRLLVISGWSPCHYQPYHPGFEPDAELLSTVDDDVAALLSGSQRWSVTRKVADLGYTSKL